MENLRKKFLLGVNDKTKEIYFGKIEITTRNGYKEFTASFDVGEAFDIDSIDLQEQCENRWDWLSPEYKLELLEDGDLTKQDVFDDWASDMDYRGFIDCSCTDYEVYLINGQFVNFQTTCGGQHDIRTDSDYKHIIFTDKKAVELILELWDKKHLKNIENDLQDVEPKINEILKRLDGFDETKKIEDFIIDNLQVEI